jgi:membrane protease YdiL (CAAX protease family)
VRLSLVFYAAFFAVALGWRSGIRGQSLLRAEAGAPIDWLRDPLLGAAAAIAVIALSQLLTRHTRSGRTLARALGRLLGPLATRQCVVLALASGVGEEALFRGALQPELGLVGTSAVFALAHLVPRRELLLWSVFSFGAGLLLGTLYETTGNLVAPTVAHFGINAVNLARLSREYGSAR